MHKFRFASIPLTAVVISILCVACQRTESGGPTGKNPGQSSDYLSHTSADKAVDGNTDGDAKSGSISVTGLDRNAWWQIDLGSSSEISSIDVWNRTDCCAERLADYWVFVSDTPFAPGDTPSTLQSRQDTWSNHQTSAPSPSTTIPVNSKGRYVRVQLAGENYLSLAEVKVNKKSGV
jgi:NedA-like, galactose-binding domain